MKPHLSTIKNYSEFFCVQMSCAHTTSNSTLGSRVANAVISAALKQDWRDSGRMRISSRAAREILLADALLFDHQHCNQRRGS